ncbi:DNA adenine methylase [Metamycoplasma neophronis]|uniref:site-specific DNA-methyltransferase (adenine-specific) n=1 Tax=Metamycoplasma neophronis TaxID=872983 RepID=A0ABY2Z178_9BACT|nr:Dam family site-specific DNA-(adenine-N6)-methyltransferase [Metamycoplasma neophronis]TPR54732.1 Dam family site-specific DNA-(adenine-N6)-methyltransferase [Metamycoplasma neophronis]
MKENHKKEIFPFVKWVGGKRQLLNEIIEMAPKEFNRYFEPFLGGGAVLFSLQPQKAFVNDINSQLIFTYETIKNNANELIELLKKYDAELTNKDKYLYYRDKYNSKVKNHEFDIELAALFIYLNKRCFNGLYRVNSEGLFNVPYNNKTTVKSFDEDNIKLIEKFLKHVTIKNVDFEKSLSNTRAKDFIFIDSPYAPLNESSFESYTKDGFSKKDHIRLAKVFKKLSKKGCYVMLTNSDTDFIKNLYKDFNIKVIKAKRLINRDADKRFANEVIITNY